jgi:hypothetical protein
MTRTLIHYRKCHNLSGLQKSFYHKMQNGNAKEKTGPPKGAGLKIL